MPKTVFLIAVAFYVMGAWAAEVSQPAEVLPGSSIPSDSPNLAQLQAALNGQQPDSVTPSLIPGLFEVVLGSQVVYLSKDGQFALQGDVIDLRSRSNVTENRRSELRGKAVAALNEQDMVVFGPEGPAKYTVTVFTDIDCGYCRKMHSQIADYNKEGIKIRYLLFPREGVGSESFNKAISVWCAPNRQEALTKAKRGEPIEPRTCDNPVQAQYELGQKLGVRGTPSLILDDGALLPGYLPPPQLAQFLADHVLQPASRPTQP